MKNTIIAYTDGSVKPNPGPCGSGATMMSENKAYHLTQFLGEGTNNIAEIHAIKMVAEVARKSGMHVIIYSDSAYSIGVLTKNWKITKNKELILKTRSALSLLKSYELRKVKAHVDIEGNESADRLAALAIKEGCFDLTIKEVDKDECYNYAKISGEKPKPRPKAEDEFSPGEAAEFLGIKKSEFNNLEKDNMIKSCGIVMHEKEGGRRHKGRAFKKADIEAISKKMIEDWREERKEARKKNRKKKQASENNQEKK